LEAKYWGAYAQTELGHGSNVRGLETQATFDAATDEFVIHSPTLSSMKWWPTGMYACTHAIVFCQLLLGDGSPSRGVFGFFVQLRDEHGDLMPGVEVGEIGPKVSAAECNIGYARFDRVRVPRSHLVAKHIKVSREGRFQAAPPKLSRYKYIGMMNIRVMLVRGASVACGKAATMAIRYSAVRRQGFLDSQAANALASGEAAILDYGVQQRRLFTALGAAYLLLWTGRAVVSQLKEIVARVEDGDDGAADALPEMHATCAGLKAHSTTWAAALVEDCRKCCGGMGYLRSSGLADLSTSYVGSVTAEGEAVVLALQTARFLIKSVAQARRGEAVAGATAYVSDAPLPPQDVARWGDRPGSSARIGALVALHRDRARRVALELADDFDAATASGLGFDAALNSVAVAGWHANECHCAYVMAKNAQSAMPAVVKDDAARAALATLLEFTLLQLVEEKGGDFAGATLDTSQMRAVRLATNELQALVRPDAVALCDSLGYSDAQLGHSTLGREDGQVYEAIYDAARRSPLNGTRMVGWDVLSPVVDMEFLRAGARTQRQGNHAPPAKL